MSVIKRWNEATSQWEVAVIGKQGPAGPTGATGPSGPAGDVATSSIWQTRGDIAVGTGASTAERLPASTMNGLSLVTNSSTSSGLAYEARMSSRVPYISGRVFPRSTLIGGWNATNTYGVNGQGSPLTCPVGVTVAQIGINIGMAQAGGAVRFAIYGSDTAGRPVAGILLTGTIPTDTIGLKMVASPFTCPSPWLWLFVATVNSSPSWGVRGFDNNSSPEYLNLSLASTDSSNSSTMNITENCQAGFPQNPTFVSYGGWGMQPAWIYQFG